MQCECKIKNEINFYSDFNIDKKQLIQKLINIKKISNIWVIKCYNLIFSSKGLISNIGSYILLIIILNNIISLIIFIKLGYPLLKDKMEKIVDKKYPQKSSNEKINTPPKRKKKRTSIRINTHNDVLIEANNITDKEVEGKY